MRPSPWRCSDHDESYIPSKERCPLLWEVFQVAMAATPPSHIILSPSTYGALQREFEQATPSDDDQEPPFA